MIQRLTISQDAVRVGVVRNAGKSTVNIKLDEYHTRKDLIDAILRIPYAGGNANTAGGIEDMRTKIFTQRGDRPGIPNIAVVMVSGKTDVNTVRNANRAKADGITVLAVGVSDVSMEDVNDISNNIKDEETSWMSPSFRIPDDTVRDIVSQICYLVGNVIQILWSFLQKLNYRYSNGNVIKT